MGGLKVANLRTAAFREGDYVVNVNSVARFDVLTADAAHHAAVLHNGRPINSRPGRADYNPVMPTVVF